MSIWSAATINRFLIDGEVEIAKSLKCLIARVSLAITAGTSTYSLPTDLLYIRRVTWLGKKLEPMPARTFHQLNVITAESEPLFYIFNQQGRNTIRLHPVPSQTVAALLTGLFGPNIATTMIVEYYQLPNSTTVKLPEYIRRRLIKYYVLYRCFEQEGVGQNLKNAKKMLERYNMYLDIFRKIHSGHFIAQMNTLGAGNKRGILAPPRYSYKYGEEGEF